MSKRYGLLLDFEGAPPTNHVVPGVPGYVNTQIPTPVGEEGEISLERARELAKENDNLRVVEIKNVKEAEEFAAASLQAGREGIAASRDEDPDRVAIERAALKASKE